MPTAVRMSEGQSRNLVAHIECPARVIYADPAQSYFPDALRRERASLLPQGELIVMPGSHHLHMDDAVGVAAAIGDFFVTRELIASCPAGGRSASTQQGPKRGLELAAFAMEVVALVAPCRETRLHLAPERARMIRPDQVAELVHEHVFERTRSPQHQRQVQHHRSVGCERAPLRDS